MAQLKEDEWPEGAEPTLPEKQLDREGYPPTDADRRQRRERELRGGAVPGPREADGPPPPRDRGGIASDRR